MLRRFNLLVIVLYTLLFFHSTPASADTIQLPQTGQITCYDTVGDIVSCAGSGQDGEKLAGTIWPSPRFIDNSKTASADQTVTDTLTGLIWAKNGNLMMSRDLSFDKDFASEGAVTWQHALDYIKKLNDEKYLDYNDWRLPNRNELASLLNKQLPNSTDWLNTQGFEKVEPYLYWSSTTSTILTAYDSAWMVDFDSGGVVKGGMGTFLYVWPVRGGLVGSVKLPQTGQTSSYATGDDGDLKIGAAWPTPRFSDNSITTAADLTVTDKLTGLTWAKSANLDGTKTWQTALTYIADLNSNSYLGHKDWRLPNRNELESLINNQQINQAVWLNNQGFSEVQAGYYWSSSNVVKSDAKISDAWSVSMDDGVVDSSVKTGVHYIWPVRGGEWGNSALSVSPGVKDFGSFTINSASASQIFTISNSVTAGDLVVSSITLTGNDNGMFILNKGTCGATLVIAAGASCSVSVTFTPSTAGAKSATLQIVSNDRTTPDKEVLLSGVWSPVTLTVNLPGSGSGTVTSTAGVTPMLSCVSPSTSCTALVDSGTDVVFSATASLGSAPVVWSGACSGVPCSFKIDADKTANADFAVYHYLKNVSVYYGTVKTALEKAKSGETVKAKNMQMLDSGVTFDTGLPVFFQGGYANIDDAAPSGYTTLVGPFKIKSGTLKVDRVKVK